VWNPPLKFTLLRRSLMCARLSEPYETLLSTRERWRSGESEIDFQFKPLIKRIEISVTVLSPFHRKQRKSSIGQFSEKHQAEREHTSPHSCSSCNVSTSSQATTRETSANFNVEVPADILQVVGSRWWENHCPHYWWVPRRVVGWVPGYFWGGQQAKVLARARSWRVPRAFSDRLSLRRGAARTGEARNRMRRGGTARAWRRGGGEEGWVSWEREREREGEGRGTETICPHMLWPAYVTAASRKRERNRWSETRNRLSAPKRGSRKRSPSPPPAYSRKRVFS
jgi:hypothetical protein